jgi:hypothetical protein
MPEQSKGRCFLRNKRRPSGKPADFGTASAVNARLWPDEVARDERSVG